MEYNIFVGYLYEDLILEVKINTKIKYRKISIETYLSISIISNLT